MATKMAPKQIPTNKIILHRRPDLDAISAYWLALTFSDRFPGIENAEIELWPQGPPPDGRIAEEHEKEGTICFDVGEGRFDHHPHDRSQEKCATDLVAEFLGVADNPALKRFLGYVHNHDLCGPTSLSRELRKRAVDPELVEAVVYLESYQLANVINVMENRFKNSRDWVKWSCRLLAEFYEQQRRFWCEVKKEFEEKARIFTVWDGKRGYRIASIESSVSEVGSFSRTKEGGYCDLCIHKVPEGHVFISGNVSSEIFIEIGKILRVQELRVRGIYDEYLLSDLELSKMPLCPIWYLPRNEEGKVFIVMNGGRKTNIEPAGLSMERIENCVRWAFQSSLIVERWFQCPHTHCIRRPCGLYAYNLASCQDIRSRVLAK